MADSQDIEAKLAAYVDGELPADQRAEIEKYLSANPQQRRLIADLMRQRDMLRDLPKASAPNDVSETLNAQLERSVLLDGPEVSGVAGTIGSWRSVAAVAATILLVGALGLTIYSLLPSPTRKPPDLATIQTIPTSHPAGDEAVTMDSIASATLPAVSEQETRVRAALAARSEKDSQLAAGPMGNAMTSVAGSSASAAPAIAPPPAAVNLPEMTEISPSTAPATELPRGESIDIATADAAATRRQLVNTMTALGATLRSSTTQPTSNRSDGGEEVVLQISQRDMAQALKVAKSFQAETVVMKSSGTKLTPTSNASSPMPPLTDLNSGNSQSQSYQSALPAVTNDPSMSVASTTQPLQVVTVRLEPMTVDESQSTQPTTMAATEPTSNPSTQPTAQP